MIAALLCANLQSRCSISSVRPIDLADVPSFLPRRAGPKVEYELEGARLTEISHSGPFCTASRHLGLYTEG